MGRTGRRWHGAGSATGRWVPPWSSTSSYRRSPGYRETDTTVVVNEFLQARSPGYRDRLDRRLPDAFAQAVTDAGTWFESELPAQLAWRFDTAEA